MKDRPTLAESARRHIVAVVLPVLVIGGAMAGLGLSRDATHTAVADLIIGNVDPRIGGVSEFLTSTQSFAKGYSVLITSDRVTRSVTRRTGLTRDQILSHTSANFDEKRPTLRLTAKAPSGSGAVALVSAMADAVTAEINRLNAPFPSSKTALRRYQQASGEYERQVAEARRLQAQLNLQAVPSGALRNSLNV